MKLRHRSYLIESKDATIGDLPPVLGRFVTSKFGRAVQIHVYDDDEVRGGSGDLYLFNLADGRVKGLGRQDAPMDNNPFSKTYGKRSGGESSKVHKVPKGHVIISYSSALFRGRKLQSLTIYVLPSELGQIISSDSVNERDHNILKWAQMRSRKKEEFSWNNVTNDEINSLVSRGYMKKNRAGATSLTPKGKNAELKK